MKKLAKRLSLVVAMVAALALMAFGFAACGSKTEIKEVYVANGVCVGPAEETPRIIMTTSTSLIISTDGTYELVVNSNGYMNAYGNSQVMTAVAVGYGTYTYTASTEEGVAEATIKLSKPTRIVYNSNVTSQDPVYLDTADEATFEGAETTAADYLSDNGKEYTLTVDTDKMLIINGLN